MTPIAEVEAAIKQFEAVEWSSSGYPLAADGEGEPTDAGWVKFGLRGSKLGWRTLEFLAWACTDMVRGGERLRFFPTAPPPYLNTPGKCLSFVLECYAVDGDQDSRFRKVAEFINWCRTEHWAECQGRVRV
jgi:hypothetical protein